MRFLSSVSLQAVCWGTERRNYMFLRFHEAKERREGGFTLIELLVVILIIAILAAIAIPVFLNQRKKGWISQTESALKNAATAQESWLTTSPTGTYTSDVGELKSEGLKMAPDVDPNLTVVVASGTRYCMTAFHTSIGSADGTYTYDSDVGAPKKGSLCGA
jgi:type IV pilus assembly protein PilA